MLDQQGDLTSPSSALWVSEPLQRQLRHPGRWELGTGQFGEWVQQAAPCRPQVPALFQGGPLDKTNLGPFWGEGEGGKEEGGKPLWGHNNTVGWSDSTARGHFLPCTQLTWV